MLSILFYLSLQQEESYVSLNLTTERIILNSGYFLIKNNLFENIGALRGNGGVFYANLPNTHIIIYEVTFISCYSSKGDGGCIYFTSNFGSSTIEKICCIDSLTHIGGSYQFGYLMVGKNKNNNLLFSSIIKCGIGVISRRITSQFVEGNQNIYSTNFSSNQALEDSTLGLYLSRNSNIHNSYFHNNFAHTNGLIFMDKGNFSFINNILVNNIQFSASLGMINQPYKDTNSYFQNCYFKDNIKTSNTNLFYTKFGFIFLIDCLIDEEISKKTDLIFIINKNNFTLTTINESKLNPLCENDIKINFSFEPSLEVSFIPTPLVETEIPQRTLEIPVSSLIESNSLLTDFESSSSLIESNSLLTDFESSSFLIENSFTKSISENYQNEGSINQENEKNIDILSTSGILFGIFILFSLFSYFFKKTEVETDNMNPEEIESIQDQEEIPSIDNKNPLYNIGNSEDPFKEDFEEMDFENTPKFLK